MLSLGSATLLFIAGIGVLAVITWLVFSKTRHFGLSSLFRWALPLTATACAIASLGGTVPLAMSCVLFASVYFGLDPISKLYFVYVTKMYPGGHAEVFGLGVAVAGVGA